MSQRPLPWVQGDLKVYYHQYHPSGHLASQETAPLRERRDATLAKTGLPGRREEHCSLTQTPQLGTVVLLNQGYNFQALKTLIMLISL